jgi:hypothetical protein
VITIADAMTEMADAMTAVNASRRQAGGVAAWRDLAAAAVAAGHSAGAWHAGQLAAEAAGSRTHGQWMATATTIIITLRGHSAEAQALAAQCREQAAEATERQAEHLVSQARAEQDGRSDAAAVHADLAAGAARDAEQADQAAEVFDAWAAAAADAAAYGRALTTREDSIHQPVGQAVAAAGGRAWIADDKHFLTGGA